MLPQELHQTISSDPYAFNRLGVKCCFGYHTLWLMIYYFWALQDCRTMQVNPVLAALASRRTAEVDWPLSEAPDDFLAYDLVTGEVCAYPAERLASVKLRKTDDGPVFPVLAPAVYFQWLPDTTWKTTSDIQSGYKRYLDVVKNVKGFPSEVPAEGFDDIDEVFSQEALSEAGGGPSFLAIDRSVIAAALQRVSKTFPTSGVESSNLTQSFFDYAEALRTAATKAHNGIERQERFVSVDKMFASDALNDVADLRECVAASCTSEMELLATVSVAFNQIARATEKLRQALVTISTQCKELANVAQLKTSIENLEENVAFFEASKEGLENKFARATAEST